MLTIIMFVVVAIVSSLIGGWITYTKVVNDETDVYVKLSETRQDLIMMKARLDELEREGWKVHSDHW